MRSKAYKHTGSNHRGPSCTHVSLWSLHRGLRISLQSLFMARVLRVLLLRSSSCTAPKPNTEQMSCHWRILEEVAFALWGKRNSKCYMASGVCLWEQVGNY